MTEGVSTTGDSGIPDAAGGDRVECPLCRAHGKNPGKPGKVQCPTCGFKFHFDPTPHDLSQGIPEAPDVVRPGWRPPLSLGGYRILDPIAEGGMSVVLRAVQESLGREVAMKVLASEFAKKRGFRARFEREARMVGRMSHPNIVKVIDRSPVDESSISYYVMEYVNGPSLRGLLQQGPLQEPHAVDIVLGIARALQYAHGMGVIHRDVKPDNVLIDEEGNPKVMDFGIAGLFDDDATVITRLGARLGTPAYMAPEQSENPGAVDHQADIYSLGVVIYECLVGKRPAGRFQLPHALMPALDSRWDTLIDQCLQPEPADRPDAVREIIVQLEAIKRDRAPAGEGVRGLLSPSTEPDPDEAVTEVDLTLSPDVRDRSHTTSRAPSGMGRDSEGRLDRSSPRPSRRHRRPPDPATLRIQLIAYRRRRLIITLTVAAILQLLTIIVVILAFPTT